MIKFKIELSQETIDEINQLALAMQDTPIDLTYLASLPRDTRAAYWRDASLLHDLADEQRKTKRFVAEYVRTHIDHPKHDKG